VPPSASPSGLPAALLGQDITAIPTTRHVVALTFDAGGNADGVPLILATLRNKGVPGTFFLTGTWSRAFPTSAAEIAAAGHLIGNHTDTHPHFAALTEAQQAAEVAAGAAAVMAATGVDPRPLFRFPFGERTAADVRQLNGLGYLCVSWTVDTVGWKGTSGGQSVDTVVSRVLGGLRPGEIVLMHVGSHPTDGSTLDAAALGRIIDELRSRGYSFVTLAALTS
jgi:peptidoglycan/xylan/chitin deacetylase (PgdA/CDA1 family)